MENKLTKSKIIETLSQMDFTRYFKFDIGIEDNDVFIRYKPRYEMESDAVGYLADEIGEKLSVLYDGYYFNVILSIDL